MLINSNETGNVESKTAALQDATKLSNSTSKLPLNFQQFEYNRPDLVALEKDFDAQLASFESATTASEQVSIFLKINELRDEFSSMYNICQIRHTSNTADKFYEAENDFFDTNLPIFEALNNKLYAALLQSKFRQSLENQLGTQLFKLAELALKTFKPEILEDLQQENQLSTEYTKIRAQAKIDFDGETYNLSSIHPLELSDNRDTRRRSSLAKWQFYADNQRLIEGIFDKLVKLRHSMAQKLGFKNYVELGYARMRRSDYNPEMVANFRRQVRELIVPIATKLYQRQQKRLGLDVLKFYDEDYKFATGVPKPLNTPEIIIENAAKMYQELSPETDRFFKFMHETQLMDLVNRNNKALGGYCTFIKKYDAPFIFSNFNGTSGDIDVLTHEAGHAFQVFSSSQQPIEEYHWPTYEAAEIHSMSMEFFTWRWMHLFFGENTEKYKFQHLSGAIQFLPYGVAVDEFQHIIYENPDLTPDERNAVWSKLEAQYLPNRNYGGYTFLERGGFWQKQSHIFSSPFYYIDYTLAQICAFQFWVLDQQTHQTAWQNYLRLCQAGGSLSFLDLVKLAQLRSPFEDGCVASVVGKIEEYLDNVDDSKF